MSVTGARCKRDASETQETMSKKRARRERDVSVKGIYSCYDIIFYAYAPTAYLGTYVLTISTSRVDM